MGEFCDQVRVKLKTPPCVRQIQHLALAFADEDHPSLLLESADPPAAAQSGSNLTGGRLNAVLVLATLQK